MKILKEIIKEELEYFREEIKNERISEGEIMELQSLAKYIDKGDVELLEWAGVKEHKNYKAIQILEFIGEKMGKPKMFDGEMWYDLEDGIMEIINN
jgi:hypothetical protein